MTGRATPEARRVLFGTFRSRLVALVLAVLVPAMASGAVLLWSAYDQKRQAIEKQIGEQARALGLVVDRQLGQNRVLLGALSAAPSLAAGDWKTFDREARDAVTMPGTWVVVIDPSGRQAVNTYLPLGTPPPERAAAQAPITWSPVQPDGARISNLFVSETTGGPIISTVRPVFLADGREARLAVSTSASAFDRIWREQRFPAAWAGSVVDSRGVVVTRSRNPAHFVGRPASPSMRQRLEKHAEGVARTRTLDGVLSITGWSRAPGYGWSFILAAPRSEIVGAARGSVLLAAGVGLILMGGGVALAMMMARNIAERMEALARAARRLEAGEEVALAPSGVAEIDGLATAFAQSAGRLAAKSAELQELNASLEARVAERSRELEAATESLVQAQKLEAVGRLTGGVAHDFNNLLMAVMGNLELLKRRVKDEALLPFVSNARQAAERGAALTSQLLAFSRKQRLEPRPTDINAIIAKSRQLLTSTLGGSIQVETRSSAGLWPALADATQLELVVMNLAINARDAMPDGGTIYIEAENLRLAEKARLPEGPPAGAFVVLSVSDTGAGMTPEVAARVFEPFFTTKDVGRGSGLGLPQVLGLAKQLGGGVELVTAPGEGTTVKVYLPRAEAVAEPEAAEPPPFLASLSGRRVLLVDDDPDVRSVAAGMLRDLGCLVVEAGGGKAAVAAASQGDDFDAVLLDFAMPEMDGAEAAARIARVRPQVTVVMMSGFADVDLLAKRWAGPLLAKPFTAAALGAQIAQATAGRTSVTT